MNILVVMADQLVPFLTSPYGDPAARRRTCSGSPTRACPEFDSLDGVPIEWPASIGHDHDDAEILIA